MTFLSSEIPNINFKDVSFAWTEKSIPVISNCNFSINKSGLWMIIGKNGSGKSTLLKLIQGILRPNDGKVNCKAKPGIVFQNPDHQILMPTCRSELLLNMNPEISRDDININIKNALNKVGLNGFEKRPIYTLSGGQKQRLTIACSLISNSNLILMDEPTALLDKTSQLNILKIIKELTCDKSHPFTALWITHRLEELRFANGVAEMKDGKLSEWQKPSKFNFN